MVRTTASHPDNAPDTQWLERMYNNRLRVPEHVDFFARWQAQSAVARQRLGGDIDVPYGDGPRQVLDAFAAPAKGAPLVVFVHGGYWKALDKSMHSFIAATLHDMGAATVVPNYAFCPRASVPQICLQVARAVAWAWQHARALNADARRITVVGHSAGAHMAAMMLACAWNVLDAALPARAVKSAVGLSGLYDLHPLMHTPSLQEVLRLTPAQVHDASPARLPAPEHGRLLALVGAEESGEYLRQTRLIQQQWGRQRVPVAQVLPGLNHFGILDALAAPKHPLHRRVRGVLAGHAHGH
ncbi:MAG: alpha/beta hydrolase [Pseudomonadota bacterium]|nr:alpha/beta hydrolase [Pseudomonadota bacterium]